MSKELDSFHSELSINDQKIEIVTHVERGFKRITYTITSEEQMATMTVALTLYLMCQSVCERLDIEIDDLALGLQDSPSEYAH